MSQHGNNADKPTCYDSSRGNSRQLSSGAEEGIVGTAVAIKHALGRTSPQTGGMGEKGDKKKETTTG